MRSELEEAIRLLHRAEVESLEEALLLLQRTVFSFAMKVCGQKQDAEDTAQEVLFKSLPHLTKLKDARALSAWLYRAAMNRCWQDRRKASYRSEIALDDLVPSQAELSALLKDESKIDPESETLLREAEQMLHSAVLKMPPPYRIVLVLHDMEELDTELVARILSLDPGTVRVRLHRARLMVRKEISKAMQGSPTERASTTKPASRPVQCQEIFANLSEYLDGELAPESCEQMRSHIEACPSCMAFIQDLKRAIDRCRALDFCHRTDAPPALRRLLQEEYQRLVGSAPKPRRNPRTKPGSGDL